MSNRITDACKPLRMPPTAKAVLLCMADCADDDGRCWPSIDRMTEYTCFGRTAVIEAIKFLEQSGIVEADRSNGRRTTYRVIPESFVLPQNQSGSRTSPADEPVRQANKTSPAPGPNQSGSRTGPVRQADSNHKEPSRTPKRTPNKTPACAVARPDDVSEEVWNDWLALRKSKKAPVTETVFRAAKAEAEKADMTLEDFLEVWCLRGSQGLQAEWLRPSERTRGKKPSAADSFRGKTYTGTSHDDLPESLRPAA